MTLSRQGLVVVLVTCLVTSVFAARNQPTAGKTTASTSAKQQQKQASKSAIQQQTQPSTTYQCVAYPEVTCEATLRHGHECNCSHPRDHRQKYWLQVQDCNVECEVALEEWVLSNVGYVPT